MTSLYISIGLLTGIWGLAKLFNSRQRQARKRAYQQFLQEDRMTSTLEYARDVTRQRQDTRIWR
jgi:hypothetical protein